MADYVVRVEAASDKAERDLRRVEDKIKNIDRKVKVDVQLPNIGQTINALEQFGKVAASVGQTALQVSRQLNIGPGAVLNDLEDLFNKVTAAGKRTGQTLVSLKDATPTRILGASFDKASSSAVGLSRSVASVGFEIFGLTQSVRILQQAFGGFFNETIGREIKLQEALLQTKTTLISTADVVQNGQRLTDPFKALQALEQPIEDTLESIRRRSLDIAGTTSDAIVSVFGVVASQIGSVGGSLKDAEDLAISFAGALGTIGMADPVLANQEIRSILSGTIDRNSRLAVMLGLTNEEVQKAKSSADGLIGFLKKRLEGFTAGQKTAAQQFAGITSNIQEVREEMSRAFGKPILQPLLVGLTEVYTRLSAIFDQLKAISGNAGQAFANVATVASQAVAQTPTLQGFGGNTAGFAREAEKATEDFANKVRAEMDKIRPLLSRLINEVIEGIARISQGFGALIKGFAVFKFEELKVAATTFANMAAILNSSVVPALQAVLNLYGQLLALPVVNYLNQVIATHQVLERIGVNSLVRLLATWKFYQESINTAIGWMQKFVQFIKSSVTNTLNGLATGVETIGTGIKVGLTQALEFAATALGQIFGAAIVVVRKFGLALIALSSQLAALDPRLAGLATGVNNIGRSFFQVEAAIRRAGVSMQQFSKDAQASLDVVQKKATTLAGSIRNLGQTIGTKLGLGLKALGRQVSTLAVGFIKFQAILFVVQAATAAATEAWGRYQRAQEQATASQATLRSLELLETKYKDLGDEMTEAQKRAREFHLQMVENRYAQNVEELEKVAKEIEQIKQEMATPGIQSIGELMRILVADDAIDQIVEDIKFLLDMLRSAVEAIGDYFNTVSNFWRSVGRLFSSEQVQESAMMQAINNITKGFFVLQIAVKAVGVAIDAVLAGVRGLFKEMEDTLVGSAILKMVNALDFSPENNEKKQKEAIDSRLEYEAKLKEEQRRIDEQRARDAEKERVELAKKAREQGLKELKEYEWQLERDLFSKTQNLQSKEVEFFKQEGEFRIDQVRRANALQLEGVEGAAKATLDSVNEYLTVKAKGELELQANQQELTIELANLERQVVDYRYEMEKKIAEIRKRAAQYDAQSAGGAGAGGGIGGLTGNTGRSTGPHLDIRGEDRESVIREVMHHIRTWQQAGIEYIQLSNAKIDVKNIVDEARLRASVERELDAHGTRVREGIYAADIAVPDRTPINANLSSHSWDPNGGGFYATNLNTGNRLLHLNEDSQASLGRSNPGGLSFQEGFYKYLSSIEGGYGKAGASAFNTSSSAKGYFQLIPSTEADLRRRGMGNIADQMLSMDFNTAAQGAHAYARLHSKVPAAQLDQMFARGDLAGIESAMSGLWPSLRGGTQQASAANQAIGLQYLPEVGTGRSGGGGTADNTPVDAGLDFSEVERLRSQWENTIQRLGDLLRKSNELRKKIIEAATEDALLNVGKALRMDQINLEQYEDEILLLQERAKLLEQVGLGNYDPRRMSIAAEEQTKIKILDREYDEAIKQIKKLKDPVTGKDITQEVADRIAQQLTTNRNMGYARIMQEADVRQRLADTDIAEAVGQEINQAIRDLRQQLQSDLISMQSQLDKSALDPGDFSGQRTLDAELIIAQQRLRLIEQFNGDVDQANKVLKPFADAVRENIEPLAEMDERMSDFAEAMERAQEATDIMVGGMKEGLSSLLSGGSISESAAEMSANMAKRFTDMFLDYAFKPIEEQMLKQFKDLFGVTDMESEQVKALKAQREAVDKNTKAIEENTKAITTDTTGTGAFTGSSPEAATDKATTSTAASTAAANAMTKDLERTQSVAEQAVNNIRRFNVELGESATRIAESLPNLESFNSNVGALPFTLGQTTEAAKGLDLATSNYGETVKKTGDEQQQTQNKLQQFSTGLVGLGVTAMSFVGGFQQIKEGGAYGTLSGLSSIFGGIASAASSFLPGGFLSGLFRASGGPVTANSPYIVGEKGPELFVPKQSGDIIPNGGTFVSSQDNTSIPFTKSTRELTEQARERQSFSALESASKIKIQSEFVKINDVNYVTTEQHEKGLKRAAEQGRALTLSTLRNSIQSRKQIGMS